jgi:hypothetical protein
MANYHLEYFYLLNMRLLTLPRPLRVDTHGGFRSTGNNDSHFFFSGRVHLSVFGGALQSSL